MKYSRTEINASVFSDILPEGAMMYRGPELPKYEFKANKVNYTVSDLRLLHPSGIKAFESILKVVANTPDCKEVSFDVSDMDEDTINIVTDILLGITYHAAKGGKNGFEMGGNFLIIGARREENIMTYQLAKSHAWAIFKYAHEKARNDEPINFLDLVCAVSESGLELFKEVSE